MCSFTTGDDADPMRRIDGQRVSIVFVNSRSMSIELTQLIEGIRSLIAYYNEFDAGYLKEWQLVTVCKYCYSFEGGIFHIQNYCQDVKAIIKRLCGRPMMPNYSCPI